MPANRCNRDHAQSTVAFPTRGEIRVPDTECAPIPSGNNVLCPRQCYWGLTPPHAASVTSVHKFRLLETYEYSDKHPKPGALPFATQSDRDNVQTRISRDQIKGIGETPL